MSAANKAWYWLAAGVLALGLNGYYQDGGLPVLHRLAARTNLAVTDAQAQLHQVTALAEVALADGVRCPGAEPTVVAVRPVIMPAEAQVRLIEFQNRLAAVETARAQLQMTRLQQVINRREMRRAQVEIQNGRLTVLTDRGQVQVALPSLPRVEVNIPQGPAIEQMPN